MWLFFELGYKSPMEFEMQAGLAWRVSTKPGEPRREDEAEEGEAGADEPYRLN